MAVLVHLHSVEQRCATEHDALYREPPYWPPPRPHIPVDEDHSRHPMWSITGFITAIAVVAGLYAFKGNNSTTVATATVTTAPTPAGTTSNKN